MPSNAAAAPSDGAAERKRQLLVKIPADATPGQTQLKVEPGSDYSLVLTVPEQAKPGDSLLLTEGDDGDWVCSLQKAGAASDRATGSQKPRIAEVRVPEGAIPGETTLEVRAGQDSLQVKVPASALPGDLLQLSLDEAKSTWMLSIVREDLSDGDAKPQRGHRRAPRVSTAGSDRRLKLTVVRIDHDACFEAMKDAACRGGAYVSPKLARGTSPPLAVPGMLVTEPVSKGEVLLRIPAHLHVSEASCKREMSELFSAVEGSETISPLRRTEVALSTCLAALLCNAISKAEGKSERSMATTSVPDFWHCYANTMIGENFSGHPYWRCMLEPTVYERLLAPSREPAFYKLMAGDCVAVHDFVKEGLPEWPEMVGSGFDSGIFMSARLSLLSREFATRHGSALVPLVDLCNHSATPAAHQSWDLQGDAMVITAVRDLEAGEELLITYGLTSNPMLLRTYGFVLPPGIEPAWTVSFPVSELIDICGPGPRKELEDRFLPLLEFQLTTAGVVDFLSDAMAACARGGGDGALLLRQLVTSKMEEYERHPSMTAALSALAKARSLEPQQAAWWTKLPFKQDCSEDPEMEQALWVKMSEYLCLTAHAEALDVVSGQKEEDLCLRSAAALRRGLARCLTGAH